MCLSRRPEGPLNQLQGTSAQIGSRAAIRKTGGSPMLKARIAREVVIRLPNHVGLLAQLSKILSDKGIGIDAIGAWIEGNNAIVRLVTEDNLRVMDALRERSYDPREDEVVLTEAAHKPGMVRHIAEKLAENGIDLHHLYGSAAAEQARSLMVFSSTNNGHAMVLLNEKPPMAAPEPVARV